VPLQTNSNDCGCFLIYFAKKFFSNPEATMTLIRVGPIFLFHWSQLIPNARLDFPRLRTDWLGGVCKIPTWHLFGMRCELSCSNISMREMPLSSSRNDCCCISILYLLCTLSYHFLSVSCLVAPLSRVSEVYLYIDTLPKTGSWVHWSLSIYR